VSDRTIVYAEGLEGIGPHHLVGFFRDWPNPPDTETHYALLKGSDHVVLARAGVDGPVVGYVTSISDGILFAYVPLLEVLAEYQRRGVGHELMRRLLLRLRGLYGVDLLCEPSLEPFYRRFGMISATGMMLRRTEHQSGRPAQDRDE
jgi:GNAT superfamily N-acetyltransferase